MLRVFSVFVLLVLHMVQPLFAKPVCTLSDSEAIVCCCCPSMDAGPALGCCSGDSELPPPSQTESCGCMAAPSVPVAPTPTESIELGFVEGMGNWPAAHADLLGRDSNSGVELRRNLVRANESAPPLRFLTQVFRL